jgi:hypothetical protein
MKLTEAVTQLKARTSAVNDADGRDSRDSDDFSGAVLLDAMDRAVSAQVEAEEEVRRLALEAAGLDPRLPVRAPVAVNVAGGLVVVLPDPDGSIRGDDIMTVVDVQNVVNVVNE